jgi:hypothetical protein
MYLNKTKIIHNSSDKPLRKRSTVEVTESSLNEPKSCLSARRSNTMREKQHIDTVLRNLIQVVLYFMFYKCAQISTG